MIDWLACTLDKEALHLETEVRQVKWERGQVTVTAEAGSGMCHFNAPRVLITVPIGVLRASPGQRGAIVFDPPISEKLAAAGSLEMGHVVRLICQFRESFWNAFKPLGFTTSSGAPVPTWWSREALGSHILVGWAGGPAAERLLSGSESEIIRLALTSLSSMFNVSESRLNKLLISVAYHNWSADPYSRGAYSYPRVGGIDASRILSLPMDDTLFFAGEATDANGHGGTVHGALESGERTAGEIVGSCREAM